MGKSPKGQIMANFASRYPNMGLTTEELNEEHRYQLEILNILGNILFKVKRKIIPEQDDESNMVEEMLTPAEVLSFYDTAKEKIPVNDNYLLGQTHRPFIDHDDEENPYDLYNILAAVYHLNYIAENYDLEYLAPTNDEQVAYQAPIFIKAKSDAPTGWRF